MLLIQRHVMILEEVTRMLLMMLAPIHLVCAGGGHVAGQQQQKIATARGTGDLSGSGMEITRTVRATYEDEVQVQIDEDQGKIRVPRALWPMFRAGGDDGWWKLKNIDVRENEIRAKFTLNFMTNPSVRIDRITGRIAIKGGFGSDYAGVCEPFEPQNVKRKF